MAAMGMDMNMTPLESVTFSVKELLGDMNSKLDKIDGKLATKADTVALDRVSMQIDALTARMELIGARMPPRFLEDHSDLMTRVALAEQERDNMHEDIKQLWEYHDDSVSTKVLSIALIPSVVSFIYTTWSIVHGLVS